MKPSKVDDLKRRLAENIESAKRYMQFAGERFGTLAVLDELERERKKMARRLVQLDPEHEIEYVQHLF